MFYYLRKTVNSILNYKTFLLLFIPACILSQDVTTYYLQNKSPEWKETISFYKNLDLKFTEAKLFEEGLTDAGKPLNLFVISMDGDFSPQSIRKKNKCILLINNAIHPGEPDGVDASMVFAKKILNDTASRKLLQHVVICIVPVFNIDGALNRGCCSRTNQNGPEQYGFRGNYQNLDLNRDFIKCDTKNTKSLTKIMRYWNPDLFVDTHVSDGADYQHVLTLIATQKDKLTPVLGNFLDKQMLPVLYSEMNKKGISMCPYVDTYKEIPDSGITGFLETPRFASGYAALFNTLSFVTETHMLKPFTQRVEATLKFLEVITEYANNRASTLLDVRKKSVEECLTKTSFPVSWELDTSKKDMILFKGYEAEHNPSSVTASQRLFYNHKKPYEKEIPFYNSYKPLVEIQKPKAYLVPQCWDRVIERLKLNDVKMHTLINDTVILVESYFIDDYKSSTRPYEGHHLKTNVQLRKEKQNIHFFAGDFIIYTNQVSNRYIIESLEPQGVDSYFTWGFFDATLQQKEWFSDYVFEEMADSILKNNNKLNTLFQQQKNTDSTFAKDAFKQLYFIYKNSDYFEKSYMRYPVYRLN